MLPSLLEVRELTVSFPDTAAPIVKKATFSLQAGEILAVIGESGAGKTTLARAIAGRLPASAGVSGQANLLGVDLLGTRPPNLKPKKNWPIAYIPQEPEAVLNPVFQIHKQIDEVLRARNMLSAAERRRCVERALALTGLSRDLATAYPHQLSGGQRQRVVIAQSLSHEPALLIADESISALDKVVQYEILSVWKQLTRTLDLALLFITHDATLISGFAQKMLVMQNGAVVEYGETGALLRSPAHRQTERILRAIAPLPKPTARSQPAVLTQAKDTVAEVKSLTKTYTAGRTVTRNKRITALADVNLSLRRGSIIGLVGSSGSGKSTLARCLAFVELPDSGEVLMDGQAIALMPSKMRRESRRRVQLVWQHSALALNPRLRVSDIIAEPALLNRKSPPNCIHRLALEIMRNLGLSAALAERTPSQISGGQRQRVALARALMTRPSLLILDEAFAGLDLPVQEEISSVLLHLKAREGLTIIFITHDLRRAAAIADEIAVIHEGRIVERAEPGRLFWNPQHEATRQLVRATVMFQT